MIGRRLPLGIDLGASRIRIASLVADRHTVRVRAIGTADMEGDVRAALADALQQIDGPETRAVAMIRACDAPLKVAVLPHLRRVELEKAIRFEGAAAFGDLEEPLVVRSRTLAEDGGRAKLLLAAAPRQKVRETIGVLRSVGLHPVRIEHEACVLARSVQVPLLDVGFRRSTLIFRKDCSPIARSIPQGGAFFTESIAQAIGTTFEAAELRKRTLGVTGAERKLLASFAMSVSEELALVRAREGVQVESLRLSGNGARLGALCDTLREQLQIPVEHVSLEQRIAYEVPADVARFTVLDWFGAMMAALPLGAASGQST